MIKLKDLLKEIDEPVSLQDQLDSFYKSNKSKLESLADDDEWDDFYEMAFEKFPDADQDDVAQALNNAAMKAGLFEQEPEEYVSEKDLETLSFGEKSQQKGVNMSDYDKKQKMPKQSPTDLTVTESKKKTRLKEMATADSKKVDSFLASLKSSVKNSRIVNQITDFIMIARLDPYASYKSLLRDILVFYKSNPDVAKAVEKGMQVSEKMQFNESFTLEEAEYRGRKVKLGKPFYTPGGPRKRAVYVRNAKGNVVKVGFGEPGMKIKKSNPNRRKSFRARHNCDNPGPRWKARYWSCRAW